MDRKDHGESCNEGSPSGQRSLCRAAFTYSVRKSSKVVAKGFRPSSPTVGLISSSGGGSRAMIDFAALGSPEEA